MAKRICVIDDCELPVHGHEWCSKHYTRWRRHGDPLSPPSIMRGASRVDQFWAKVDKRGPDECWPWTAALNRKGYGQIADGRGGCEAAYRFSYRLHHGEIRDGFTIDHSCHTRNCAGGDTCPHRRCVNPAHLRAVTNVVNVALGVSFSASNSLKTHCKRGHPLTPENSYGYKGRRQCKTCAREAARQRTLAERQVRRERYAAARAAGLSAYEAQLARGRAT